MSGGNVELAQEHFALFVRHKADEARGHAVVEHHIIDVALAFHLAVDGRDGLEFFDHVICGRNAVDAVVGLVPDGCGDLGYFSICSSSVTLIKVTAIFNSAFFVVSEEREAGHLVGEGADERKCLHVVNIPGEIEVEVILEIALRDGAGFDFVRFRPSRAKRSSVWHSEPGVCGREKHRLIFSASSGKTASREMTE